MTKISGIGPNRPSIRVTGNPKTARGLLLNFREAFKDLLLIRAGDEITNLMNSRDLALDQKKMSTLAELTRRLSKLPAPLDADIDDFQRVRIVSLFRELYPILRIQPVVINQRLFIAAESDISRLENNIRLGRFRGRGWIQSGMLSFTSEGSELVETETISAPTPQTLTKTKERDLLIGFQQRFQGIILRGLGEKLDEMIGSDELYLTPLGIRVFNEFCSLLEQLPAKFNLYDREYQELQIRTPSLLEEISKWTDTLKPFIDINVVYINDDLGLANEEDFGEISALRAAGGNRNPSYGINFYTLFSLGPKKYPGFAEPKTEVSQEIKATSLNELKDKGLRNRYFSAIAAAAEKELGILPVDILWDKTAKLAILASPNFLEKLKVEGFSATIDLLQSGIVFTLGANRTLQLYSTED
ncbi:MAG: hypothetical protein HQ564_06060 [Candidatus Saganbacteria bacterium]|nr:hypothetical protein [Candidatus Saganbacteria bacterium]